MNQQEQQDQQNIQYEMDNNNNQQTNPLKFTIPYNDTNTLDLIIKLIGGSINIDKQNCYQNPNDDKGDYFIEIYLKN